jgi:hypothetical protein
MPCDDESRPLWVQRRLKFGDGVAGMERNGVEDLKLKFMVQRMVEAETGLSRTKLLWYNSAWIQ